MRERGVSRRQVLTGAAAAGAAALLPAGARRVGAQVKPSITYWNGLTGADGKVMDELIGQFTQETGIKIEQQRIPWADLYAKLQVSVPAGEGPDLALIHTIEVPHFANDGVLEPIADATAAAKGFRGDDYLSTTWQGGIYEGKRYAIPLDVPQHLLYMNVKVMKDAGLAGKVPGSKDDLLAMARQMTKGDMFGFAIGTLNPGKYTWGFQNLLWQNGANVYAPDLKRSALADPAAIEAAEFFGTIHAKDKMAPPANANCRDAFIAGKIGMWIAGSWNFTGLREAKVDFTVAPVPKIFKKPVVWSMPHQFTFPKPKAADAARREAAWAHVRWISDHVAEWTLKAGQVSARRAPHTDTRITGDPVLKTLLIETIYIGQKPARAAMEDLARQINALPE
jgi:multiple sugar transport system substrate-binding protein